MPRGHGLGDSAECLQGDRITPRNCALVPQHSTEPKNWDRTMPTFMGQNGALMLVTGLWPWDWDRVIPMCWGCALPMSWEQNGAHGLGTEQCLWAGDRMVLTCWGEC